MTVRKKLSNQFAERGVVRNVVAAAVALASFGEQETTVFDVFFKRFLLLSVKADGFASRHEEHWRFEQIVGGSAFGSDCLPVKFDVKIPFDTAPVFFDAASQVVDPAWVLVPIVDAVIILSNHDWTFAFGQKQ